MLSLNKVSKRFGGLLAVDSLEMTINKGEMVGLIGPNGAGKTTLFNLITGYYRCSGGRITFGDRDITGLMPHEVAAEGISRTFQATKLFSSMTAFENVVLGGYLRSGLNVLDAVLPSRQRSSKMAQRFEKAAEVLRLLKMNHISHVRASDLSNKDQKLLQIAVAVANEPQLLLLDEPVAGMSVQEIDDSMRLILDLNNRGTGILLIEHNMRAVMGYCKRIIALNYGRKIAEGRPEDIKNDKEVIRAYLGSPAVVA